MTEVDAALDGDGGQRLAALRAAHPAVGDLAQLVELLERRDRLAIGTDRAQHAAALLERLAQRGIRLDTPEAALLWLAPVLCVTARDRVALAHRLRPAGPIDASPADEAAALPTLPGERAEAAAIPGRRRGLLGVALLAAVLVGLLATGFALGGSGGTAGPEAAGGVSPTVLFVAAITMIATGLGLLVRRALSLGAAPAGTPPNPLPRGRGLDWFDGGALYGPLRLMGRARRPRSRRLDLPGTIAETVRRAGWPSLVLGGRARVPEHLVLVQLAAADDPQRIAAAALLDRLRAAGLRVSAFTFQAAPDWLRAFAGGPETAMARVAAMHAGARLLVVSDGGPLWNPMTGRALADPRFAGFALRVLVTPRPRTTWSRCEAALDRGGWRLAELSTAGIAELGRWLSGPREPLPLLLPTPSAADLAELLGRDERLLAEDAPDPALRTRLLQRLAAFLDPDPLAPPAAMNLLRVLAFGARLPPGTVERVAGHCTLLDGPTPDEEGLRRLLRLPWLVRGRMPIWLREDLLRALPETLRAQGRQAWLLHLADRDPAAGLPRHDPDGRLVQEARRVLARPSPLADALMRRELGLDGVVARRGGAWISSVVSLLALLLLPLASLFEQEIQNAIAALQRWVFAPLPLTVSPQLDGLVATGVALLGLVPALPRWARRGIDAVVLYLAAGVAFRVDGTAYGAGLDATVVSPIAWPLALLALTIRGWAWCAPPAGAPPPQWRPVPGDPWAMMLVLTLAWPLTSQLSDLLDPARVRSPWPGLGTAVAITLVAMALLSRHLGETPVATRLGGRIAALTCGIAALWQIGFELLAIQPKPANVELIALAGLVAGIAAIIALRPLGHPSWPRVVIAAILYPTLSLLLRPLMVETWLAYLQVIPPLLVAVTVLFARRAGGMRLPAALTVLALAGGLRLLVSLLSPPENVTTALPAVELVFLWPLLRALRPDLAAAPDGLWRRSLAFLPCWIGIAGFGLSTFGAMPTLAIPVAAWLASRYGVRALPVIAIMALLPMALRWRGTFGIGVTLGGGLGAALAALLVAGFVCDRGFREGCLAATRLKGWQVAGLAVLPLTYASPQFMGLDFWSNPYPLVLTIAALIGLSRVPMRASLLALVSSILAGAAVFMLIGLPPTPGIGTVLHAMRNLPGDLVSALFAFGLFRMLRDGAVPAADVVSAPGAWLLRWAVTSPVLLAAVMALVIWPFSATLTLPALPFQWQARGMTLDPFVTSQFLMLTVFVAAAAGMGGRPHDPRLRLLPALRVPSVMRLPGLTIPALPTVGIAALILSLLPSLPVELGPVRLVFFGGSVGGLLTSGVTLWAFHRLGAGLADLLRAPPPPMAGLPLPVFDRWPTRVGLACAIVGPAAWGALLAIPALWPTADVPAIAEPANTSADRATNTRPISEGDRSLPVQQRLQPEK